MRTLLLLLVIPFMTSCQKEDNLQIKDLEVVAQYPTIVTFEASMPDGSLRTFYAESPDETRNLIGGAPNWSNEPTGVVLYYDGFDIHLTVFYSFITKAICRVNGSIDGHTFVMSLESMTMNICNGAQNVPVTITLH